MDVTAAPAGRLGSPQRAVLLAGPPGSGKTTVAVELGRLLDEAGTLNAVVDLDWLCWAGPGIHGADLTRLLVQNLRAVAGVYRAAGIGTLVLARAVQQEADVHAIRAAVGGALVALRLSAPGTGRPWERLHLPAVRNHGRTAAETAVEVGARLGWLPA